ncbi:uncharacterized protein LOC112350665 [Selaginella moellendorffii]|uniref:uncharacterized protein LOC112350665 n=1 Tax=Selaginella moellendorffii TaxID=88036 RepID=UPI000D1C7616|nr:uncharacterized protein LOC112350665 [Selaginella moellendorffii]|eukprot:XP_024543039.1 uncharacterized protein LOC112350665 [Selaginella moellendorffii]
MAMVGVYQSAQGTAAPPHGKEMLRSGQDIKIVGGRAFNVYPGEEYLHILPEDKENKGFLLRKDGFPDEAVRHAAAMEYIAVELADQKENLERVVGAQRGIQVRLSRQIDEGRTKWQGQMLENIRLNASNKRLQEQIHVLQAKVDFLEAENRDLQAKNVGLEKRVLDLENDLSCMGAVQREILLSLQKLHLASG